VLLFALLVYTSHLWSSAHIFLARHRIAPNLAIILFTVEKTIDIYAAPQSIQSTYVHPHPSGSPLLLLVLFLNGLATGIGTGTRTGGLRLEAEGEQVTVHAVGEV